MKKGKPDKKVEVKNFTQVKDIIPDKLVPTLKVREARVPKAVEPTNLDTLDKNKFVQDPLFDEWPADEVVAAFDFGVTVEKVFKDPTPLKMPPSFIKSPSGPLVTMKRYKEYLAAFVEKNSVAVSRKALAKQNSQIGDFNSGTKLRRSGSFAPNPEKMDLADFQRVDHSDKIDIKVCEYFERPETHEEAEERKKKEEALNKGKKKPAAADKKKPGQAVEEEPVVMDYF